MTKPGDACYNRDDERRALLKSIARHAKGIAHAAEKLAGLRESTKSGSESEQTTHPRDKG